MVRHRRSTARGNVTIGLFVLLVALVGGVLAVGLLAPGNNPAAVSGGFVAQTRAALCRVVQPQPPQRYTLSLFSCDRPVPAGMRQARALTVPANDQARGYRFLRYNALSIWRAGVMLAADRSAYSPVIVWSQRRRCALGLDVPEHRHAPHLFPAPQIWTCPRNIGELSITAVRGPSGVVSFRGTSGQRGTFDLATQQWKFAP